MTITVIPLSIYQIDFSHLEEDDPYFTAKIPSKDAKKLEIEKMVLPDNDFIKIYIRKDTIVPPIWLEHRGHKTRIHIEDLINLEPKPYLGTAYVCPFIKTQGDNMTVEPYLFDLQLYS